MKRFLTPMLFTLALTIGVMLTGCQSETPTQQLDDLYVTYTGSLDLIDGISPNLPKATLQKIENDRAPVKKELDVAQADVASGASANTITSDLALVQSLLQPFTNDQTTFANPFAVQAATVPTTQPGN